MTETFQITPEQAEAYERLFVPALFGQWAGPMTDIADVEPGQRVLDVACGTGVLTRAVADRLAGSGSVVGLDLNPAMLDVAARVRPDIAWRQGDVASMPFEDGQFDVVLCQSALFFFPDVPGAVLEMARVLRPGGTLAVQTYASLADQPGFSELERIVARYAPADALHLIETYWSQGDLEALDSTFAAAGLDVVETRSKLGTADYGTVQNLVDTEVRGTPLAERLTDEQIAAISRDAQDVLAKYVTTDGLRLPIRALLVAGRLR